MYTCGRLFQSSAKRDLHETRICIARYTTLSLHYGQRLDLGEGIVNDFTHATVTAMEQQFVVNQSNTLIRKSTSEEPFFETNPESTPETTDIVHPTFACLNDYLAQRTQSTTNITQENQGTIANKQDHTDTLDKHQDDPDPSTPDISQSTPDISQKPVRSRMKKTPKKNQFIDDEAQESGDEHGPTKKAK